MQSKVAAALSVARCLIVRIPQTAHRSMIFLKRSKSRLPRLMIPLIRNPLKPAGRMKKMSQRFCPALISSQSWMKASVTMKCLRLRMARPSRRIRLAPPCRASLQPGLAKVFLMTGKSAPPLSLRCLNRINRRSRTSVMSLSEVIRRKTASLPPVRCSVLQQLTGMSGLRNSPISSDRKTQKSRSNRNDEHGEGLRARLCGCCLYCSHALFFSGYSGRTGKSRLLKIIFGPATLISNFLTQSIFLKNIMSASESSRPVMRACKPLKLLPGACNHLKRWMTQMQGTQDKPLTIVLPLTPFSPPPANRRPDNAGWTAWPVFLAG